MNFKGQYFPDREYTDKEMDDQRLNMCCCSPDLPHGEQ
jgi:hypothetical protein